MIRIVIDDAGQLSEKEATALGHMFMHLAGHSLVMDNRTVGAHTIPQDVVLDAPPPVCSVPQAVDTWIPQPPVCSVPQAVDTWIPQPPVNTSVDVDANGIRWDIRIHARNKSQTPSGVWKLGRNMDPAYVKQVLAELTHPIPPTIAVSPNVLVLDPVPMPPIPVPPVASPSELYDTLINKVTTGMGDGTRSIATVNTILKGFNVSNLAALGLLSDADKVALIPRILQELA